MLGLPGLIGQLAQDAIALVRAEVELAKSKVADRLRRSRTAIILLVAALVIVQASIVGLVVGLVLALVPLVGAAGAGLVLLVAGLVIAGLLAWAAMRLFSTPSNKPPEVPASEAGS